MKILKSAVVYADMVKLAHTLFALPFALAAVCLAYAAGAQISAEMVFWIILAFAGARAAAMGFNRVADARFDALNPRTKSRPISAGKISAFHAKIFVAASSAVFIFSAWMLNALCFALSFPALAWLFFYSYTKRFTSLAHYVLGAAIALSPLGAWMAVTGGVNFAIVLFSGAALFQIAGFDLIYAMQDEEFDKKQKLFSVPARHGSGAALSLAALSFALSAAGLFAAGLLFRLGTPYFAAAGLCVLIYIFGCVLTCRCGVKTADAVFFYMNVSISALVFLGVAADVFLR